jgi:hypothetical protein
MLTVRGGQRARPPPVGFRPVLSHDDVTAWINENSGWIGFAGFVLTILFGALAIYFWRRPYRKKLLGAERLSGYSLVQVQANEGDKHPLKLVYGSHDVTAPYITVLRVGNMGDEEVKADEFDDPITIEFTKGKLLAYDVIDKSKPNIKPTFTVDTEHPNRVTIKPLLLNGHEWIDLQCVTDGNPGVPEVQSRVAGETKSMIGMMDRAEKTRSKLVWLTIFCAIGVLGLSTISLFTTTPFPDQEMLPFVAFGTGFTVGSIPYLNQVEMRRHRSWAKKRA